MSTPGERQYGPLFTAEKLEQAVVDQLKSRIDEYLSELETRTGRTVGSVERPRSWQVLADFDEIPGDQLPDIVVVSPGFADAPTHDGGGFYSVWWRIGIGVLVNAKDKNAARSVAHLYGAAIRGVLGHRPSLNGIATGYSLDDESYTDAETSYPGWTALLSARFEISAVYASGFGPPPYGDVHEVDIDARLAVADGDYGAAIPLVRRSAP